MASYHFSPTPPPHLLHISSVSKSTYLEVVQALCALPISFPVCLKAVIFVFTIVFVGKSQYFLGKHKAVQQKVSLRDKPYCIFFSFTNVYAEDFVI